MPSRPSHDVSVKLRSPTEQNPGASAIQRLGVRDGEVPVQESRHAQRHHQQHGKTSRQPRPQPAAAAVVGQQQRAFPRGTAVEQKQPPERARHLFGLNDATLSGAQAAASGLARNAQSVSYYFDMESPADKRKRLALLAAAATSPSSSRFCRPQTSPATFVPLRSPLVPVFEVSPPGVTGWATRPLLTSARPFNVSVRPRYLLLAGSQTASRVRNQKKEELAAAIEAKSAGAHARRTALLRARSQSLRRRFDAIRHRVLIRQHQLHIALLRFRARQDFAMSAAHLRRQLLLQRRESVCAAANERAQVIALLARLRKSCMTRPESASAVFRDPTGCDPRLPVRSARVRRSSAPERPLSSEQYTPCVPAASRKRLLSFSGVRHPDTELPHLHNPASDEECPLVVDSDAFPFNIAEERMRPRQDSGSFSPDTSGCSDSKLEWENGPPPTSDCSQMQLLVSLAGQWESIASLALSDNAVDQDVFRLLALIVSVQRPAKDKFKSWDEDLALAKRLRVLQPPITRATLSELELEEMEQNAQLRHDLVFDAKLEFRPNLAGEAGEAKKARWDDYWESFRLELEGPEGTSGHVLMRIPVLVYEIRQILEMLLDREWDVLCHEIRCRTDVTVIARQLMRGIFDASAFVGWLANLLRDHCRPERVAKIDHMVTTVHQGRYAEAFKTAFEVLELMKIDVANFQLVHIFRPLALQCSIKYEWNHFKLQLEAGLIGLSRTASWLKRGARRNPGRLFDETFVECVVDLITMSAGEFPDPETFYMDASRLNSLHNDYQDIAIVGAILLIFRQLAGPRCTAEAALVMKQELWVLLLEPGTTMAHITAHILSGAERARGAPFSAGDRSVADGFIDRTLIAGSKLLGTLKRRVAQALIAYLIGEEEQPAVDVAHGDDDGYPDLVDGDESGTARRGQSRPNTVRSPAPWSPPEGRKGPGTLDADILRRFGLADLEENILDLAERLRELATHNRCVYHPAYKAIWENLDDLDEEDGDDEVGEREW